jgi:hypothetical protein
MKSRFPLHIVTRPVTEIPECHHLEMQRSQKARAELPSDVPRLAYEIVVAGLRDGGLR